MTRPTQGTMLVIIPAARPALSATTPMTQGIRIAPLAATGSMMPMLPVASSGAILMPWIIGIVAEKAGLAAGMASNIVPCVGLIVFTLLVARLAEE